MNNITITGFVDFLAPNSLISFFIKAFSVVFAILFFVYAVVSYKQTEEISRTVLNPRNRFILFISFLQIVSSLVLLAFAIVLV